MSYSKGYSLIALFYFGFLSAITAQKTTTIVELNTQLEVAENSEQRVEIYKGLVAKYVFIDTTKAKLYATKIDSISQNENNIRASIASIYMKGLLQIPKAKYQEAITLCKEALGMCEGLNLEAQQADLLNDIGFINTALGQWDSAYTYLNKALIIRESIPDITADKLTMTHTSLAAICVRLNNYSEAFRHYYAGIDEASRVGDSILMQSLYNNIGLTYYNLNRDSLAISNYLKAARIAESMNNIKTLADAFSNLGLCYVRLDRDSARYFLNEAIDHYDQVGNKRRKANTLGILGDYERKKGRLSRALGLLNESKSIFQTLDDKKGEADTRVKLGRVQLDIGDYEGSLRNFDFASDQYQKYKNLEGLSRVNLYQSTAQMNLSMPERALESYKQHIIYKDSLSNLKYNKDVEEIQVKYETEKKDLEIEKQELVIKNERTFRNSIIWTSGLLLVFGTFLLWWLFLRSRKNKQLYEQSNIIQSQKIDQLEKEKKILSMNAMIEGQEAERSRIAKDLHDGLGGLLSTVKAHFSNIQSEIQKIEKIDVYNRANELVDEACDEVRRISHNLMPGALRLEGLKTAVEHLGDEMSTAHPFTVRVETIGFKTRMEESKEVFVYRIIQESLNNIIKHAGATDVLIQLSETEEEYHFIVEDDGQGFDPLQIESGLGLKSIQSRVDFLKGNLDIDTKAGIGTSITIHIPKL